MPPLLRGRQRGGDPPPGGLGRVRDPLRPPPERIHRRRAGPDRAPRRQDRGGGQRRQLHRAAPALRGLGRRLLTSWPIPGRAAAGPTPAPRSGIRRSGCRSSRAGPGSAASAPAGSRAGERDEEDGGRRSGPAPYPSLHSRRSRRGSARDGRSLLVTCRDGRIDDSPTPPGPFDELRDVDGDEHPDGIRFVFGDERRAEPRCR